VHTTLWRSYAVEGEMSVYVHTTLWRSYAVEGEMVRCSTLN